MFFNCSGISGGADNGVGFSTVEIAQCQFKVLTPDPQVTRIQGLISELRVIVGQSGVISTIADVNVVAGDGFIQLNGGTSIGSDVLKIIAAPTGATKCGGYLFVGDDGTCKCTTNIFGDVNGDCVVRFKF